MKFIEALRSSTSKLYSELEDSKLYGHSGDKGEFREQIISKLLRQFLPSCYGLKSGEVFSQDGESSKQIDIVIYDTVYSHVLFKDKSNSLFPCESVYGEIEVKSNLSSDELDKSIDNIASLKNLKREESTFQDITPFYNLALSPESFRFPKEKRNPYLGVIYGYNGISYETLMKTIDKKMETTKRELMPDLIFNQNKKYMIVKTKEGRHTMQSDFDGYSYLDAGDDILPIMFLILNSYLNTIRLKAPNYFTYLQKIITPYIKNQS